MKESEKLVDPQLWHACAGSMVQIPPLNSLVFYFPQGHAEHCLAAVDFSASPQIPPLILCRVAAVKFCADSGTDEVHAKLTLVPLPNREVDLEEGALLSNGSDSGAEKPSSFAKTLTQSDANNGGGFSVPRYCAETIFPRLDYTADPQVQTVVAKDVHDKCMPYFLYLHPRDNLRRARSWPSFWSTDTDLAIAKELMEAKGIKQVPWCNAVEEMQREGNVELFPFFTMILSGTISGKLLNIWMFFS